MSDNIHIINDGPDANDISEVVIECVRNNCHGDTSAFNVAEITRETNLWDLSFDGLDMVEIVINIEEALSAMPPYHSVSIVQSCINIC